MKSEGPPCAVLFSASYSGKHQWVSTLRGLFSEVAWMRQR
jgi:hypothetical protein